MQKAVRRCEADKSSAGSDVELALKACSVGFHGSHRNVEALGDLFVGVSPGEQLQYVAFAPR
jgi:hypothetical protein